VTMPGRSDDSGGGTLFVWRPSPGHRPGAFVLPKLSKTLRAWFRRS
jgi:hypothetical protein